MAWNRLCDRADGLKFDPSHPQMVTRMKTKSPDPFVMAKTPPLNQSRVESKSFVPEPATHDQEIAAGFQFRPGDLQLVDSIFELLGHHR